MKAVLAAVLIAAPAAAWATGPLQINTDVLVEKRVAASDGTTRSVAVSPDKVVPGDKVTLRLRYRNTGGQPLSGVVLSNPVPAGMAYRGPAAGTPDPEISVDGQRFAALGQLQVRTPAGAMRSATQDDVVAVRWRLPRAVAAGAQGQFAFQAVLK